MNLIIVFLIASVAMFLWSFIQTEKEKEKQRLHGIKGKQTVLSSKQFSYFFLWRTFDNWIDFSVYPFIIALLGVSYGFGVMVAVTFVTNATYLALNNSSEEDWTFMGLFNRLRDNDSHVWLLPYVRLMKSLRLWKFRKGLSSLLLLSRRILRIKVGGKSLSKPIGFLYFSVREDSFCAINFLYHKNAKLSDPKVLSLYILSHTICNLVWLPVALGIAWSVDSILKFQP